MKKFGLLTSITLGFSALSLAAVVLIGGYSYFGDAGAVSPGYMSAGAGEIRSNVNTAPGYGGIDFAVPAGLTLADLNMLSTDWMVTEGGNGGGSPRFVIEIQNPADPSDYENIFVYLGDYPNYVGAPLNTWMNSGNLLSPTSYVEAPGGPYYDVYSDVQATFGDYKVTAIYAVNDSFWFFAGGVLKARLDNVNINGSVTTFANTPSSANACKNNGWKTLKRADDVTGFSNQGDCIQYYNTGK